MTSSLSFVTMTARKSVFGKWGACVKKAGKTVGFFFAGIVAFLALLCIVTLCWGLAQQSKGTVSESLPVVAEDFVPAVRLAIFTDTHNENDVVAQAIDTAYALFEKDPVYKGIDAFFCMGDFSSIGEEKAYRDYTATVKAHVKAQTPCITIHGNHEFKNRKHYKAYFEQYFEQAPNTVTDINGFTCIAFSGERSLTEWTFTPKSLQWLSGAIRDAEGKADGKPIFVFQHPHPWGTVYGSSVWGNPQINAVLNGHGNVVDFSGHSHFPFSDPRSINQASYTAVGCGSLHRFELDRNGIVGQHPEGVDAAAELCIAEADNDGSVRLRGYDLRSQRFFCDYYIDNINDEAAFPYTYKNMKAHDKAPVFPTDTGASARRDDAGEWVLSFDEAQPEEGFIVHEYQVKIRDESGKIRFSTTIVNDYYVFDEDAMAHVRLPADTLEAGKHYTAIIRAESAYHYRSEPMTLAFTAAH